MTTDAARNEQAQMDGEAVEAIRELVHTVTAKFDRRYMTDCITADRYPTELLTALEGADLLGVGVPVEQGGVGGGLTEEVAMVEALARAGISPFFLIIAGVARVPVMRHGNGAEAARFVAATLGGDRRPCFAITEPDAGTNSFRIRTTARPDGDGWRVSGEKVFISGAERADQMLVVANTASATEDRKAALSLLIVDMASPGIELQPQRIVAAAPCQQNRVFLDDVPVPGSAVIGEPGHAARYLFGGLNHERAMTAAMAIGLGDFVLEKGADYARHRAPFGRPIGGYQAIQHPLARAKIELEAARLMTYTAASAFDRGDEDGTLANMAKLLASEAAYAACDAAIQAHGGHAFDAETDLIDFLPLLRALRVAPINNEMILNFVGERLLGLPKSY